MPVRALLWSIFVAVSAIAQCAPDAAAVLQHPVYKYRGLYQNRAYGFSVMIPKGFVGLYNRDPNYVRGFTILLADRKASVTVTAPVNSREYPDARAAAEGALQHYEKHGRKILSSNFEQTKTGDRPAVALRVRYTCPPSGTEYLAVETLAVRDNVHSITWEGPASAFDETSRELIEELKRTWKFIEVK